MVAFAFQDAPGLADHAHDVVPSRLEDIQSVIAELAARGVSAAIFVGKFGKQELFARRDRRSMTPPGISRAVGCPTGPSRRWR